MSRFPSLECVPFVSINTKVDFLIKQKGLSLNEEKSVCLIIGSKKQKKRATEDLLAKPLMCGKFETQEKQLDKWLGQTLSSAGLADCVLQTVLAREGKIKGASIEIALIINDWRAKVTGGMETALMLWETCCIPSLMHGAGTWVEMPSEAVKRLNKIQNYFVRLVLRIGPGSPLASILWDTSLLDMQFRVYMEKLMIIMHIRSLDEETLANKIYEEQKHNKWPGLYEETRAICEELQIEDCNTTRLGKQQYKVMALAACHRKNEEKLRLMATEGKCARIRGEEYGRKEYMKNQTIENTREWFKTRYGLMPFAGNFSHNRRYAPSDWLCRCKTMREEEGHITSGSCEVYGDLKSQFGDLKEDKNLVDFFRAVLDRRDELEEEDRQQEAAEDRQQQLLL